MSAQTVSFESAESMPVTLVDGVNETLEATPADDTVTVQAKAKRMKDLGKARDAVWIDPRKIVIENGHNPRNYELPENHAHLDALKRSIKENGTLVPLLVRFDTATGSAVLVDGECRLRANLELIAEGVEIDLVPTTQVSGNNEASRLLIAITANTGKPLSKWELGAAFQRLYNFGWDEAKIALKTGYDERFIHEAMELADAPDEVKQLLSSQAVTPALALSQLRTNGSAAVQTLQSIANDHKASGKAGPAKRAKANPAPAQSSAPAQPTVQPATNQAPVAAKGKRSTSAPDMEDVYKSLCDLLVDVNVADLTNSEVESVSVSAIKLLTLSNLVNRAISN